MFRTAQIRVFKERGENNPDLMAEIRGAPNSGCVQSASASMADQTHAVLGNAFAIAGVLKPKLQTVRSGSDQILRETPSK
jgi:hypothetical protein